MGINAMIGFGLLAKNPAELLDGQISDAYAEIASLLSSIIAH